VGVLGRLCEGALRETDGARGDERASDVEGAHGNLTDNFDVNLTEQ